MHCAYSKVDLHFMLKKIRLDSAEKENNAIGMEWKNDNKFMRICSSQAEANANAKAKNAYEKSRNNNKDSLEKLYLMKYKSHVKSKHVILLTWTCTIMPLQQCIHLLNLKPNP